MRRFVLMLPVCFVLPFLLVLPMAALAQGEAPPVLTGEEAARLLDLALAGKQWALLASLCMVGVVFVLRRVGARVLPWLGTPRGAVTLSMVGGTSTALAVALGAGTPFSLGLLMSCLMTAAGASGLFSWGQTLTKGSPPRPGRFGGSQVAAEPPPVCSPRDAADGKC